VAAQKGRVPIEGVVLGFVFSVFGALIEANLPADESVLAYRRQQRAAEVAAERELHARG